MTTTTNITKLEISREQAVTAVQAVREADAGADVTLMQFVRERVWSDSGQADIAWLANHRSMNGRVRATLNARIKKASTPDGTKVPHFELKHDGAEPASQRVWSVAPYTGPSRNKPSPRKFLAAMLTVVQYATDAATTGLEGDDDDANVAAIADFITKHAGSKLVWSAPRSFGEVADRGAPKTK